MKTALALLLVGALTPAPTLAQGVRAGVVTRLDGQAAGARRSVVRPLKLKDALLLGVGRK